MSDDSLERIEKALAAIQERNARVEAEKAWETSFTRIAAICAITYVVACALLYVIGVEKYWLGALMPTVGFYLSAQSLPALKNWWVQARLESNRPC